MISFALRNLATKVSWKFLWICHEALFFFLKRAIHTTNPYSLNSKLGIIIFELRLHLKGIHKMNTHMESTYNCMFVEPNSKARVTPKMANPTPSRKEKAKIEICGVLQKCHGIRQIPTTHSTSILQNLQQTLVRKVIVI
jgi:hypothetical protein